MHHSQSERLMESFILSTLSLVREKETEIARTMEYSTAAVIGLLARGWPRNNTNTNNTND